MVFETQCPWLTHKAVQETLRRSKIDKQLNKLIETIDKQIAEMEKAMEDHIASDITVQQKVNGITKIK